MFAPRCLLAVVASVAVVAAAVAADATLPDGKYALSANPNFAVEERLALLELKTADGKTAVKVTDGGAGPNKWDVSGWAVKDGLVTADLTVGPMKYAFEGKLDAKAKRVVGTMASGPRAFRVVVASTDVEELTAQTTAVDVKLPEEMQVLDAPRKLQMQAFQEKEADKRKALLDQVKEARAKATAEAPKLLRKVVEADGTDVGVLYFAVPDLLGRATAAKATADDVKKWAEKGIAVAAAHGPRAERAAVLNTAVILAGQEGFAGVALPYAEKAVASTEKEADTMRVGPLKALAQAQAAAGKTDAAKDTQASVEKIETALDAEYKKAGPGFDPGKYAGRQDKEANRVAVLELFTGAMCPPCTAADLAFDGLEVAYSPKDLVLLQYHQHIPGPDPLTNPDTVARWGYYGKLFPKDMGGVPSSVFNGKPKLGGGGGRPQAKGKFDAYVKEINAILEQKADVTVAGTATLSDGTVSVDATLTGKADTATVRIILAEEEVRYLGSNTIRLHHQVVRSMFGKADGWKVKDLKGGKATASVKLDDLKKSLSEYMTKYHTETAKFSNPDRPLKFEHLKVIVIVQDDETGEILNAAQFDVEGKKS